MPNSNAEFKQVWQGAPNYPLVYRVPTGTRILSCVGAALFAAISYCVVTSIWFGVHSPKHNNIPTTLMCVVMSFGIMMCFAIVSTIYAAWYALTGQLVVSADSIELRKPLWPRKLRRSEIAGRRLLSGKGSPYGYDYLRLIPRQGRPMTIRTDGWFKTDHYFRDWVASLPDLDARDRTQSIK